jgi:hypothetical protein
LRAEQGLQGCRVQGVCTYRRHAQSGASSRPGRKISWIRLKRYLKRKFKTAEIHQFVQLLSSDIPAVEQSSSPLSLLTPTVIVMDRVVRSKNPNAQLKDVINDLESIVSGLKRVAEQPEEIQRTDPELIEKLRTDCLDISRPARIAVRPG